MAPGNWRPLLTGDLAARAEKAVNAIADALAKLTPGAAESPSVEEWSPANFSLGGGTAGLALFYGYLAKTAPATAAESHVKRAEDFLEHAVEALAATPMRAALYGGFTGVAWVAEHLGRLLDDEAEPDSDADAAQDDMSEDVDESLLSALAPPWTDDYDLISGLVGFGVYALERVPRPSAVRCVEAIVDRLDETAECVEQGVTWFTSPDLLPPRNREQHPRGYYNLGVAHGVPGVIGFLADACRLGIRSEKARPLLEGAMRWVWSQRLPERRGARYPACVLPDVEAEPSRLAWCYGDPGVAAALLYAARALDLGEWEQRALDIATHAASTAPEHSGVRDAAVCHGALGLAHLYNRIYQAGGGEPFADAALLWYRKGLDMRRPHGGLAGFEAWELASNMEMRWQATPGFLTGAAGVGLALLAGLTSVEPNWDRVLMLAIPPR